jgi:hypothetical protein
MERANKSGHQINTLVWGLIGTLLAAALIGAVTMKEDRATHNADIRQVTEKLDDLRIIACDANPTAIPCRRKPQ